MRDIAATCNGGDAMRVGTEAFDLIQMAGERLLAEIMADAWRITLNRGAKTVQAGDFNLAVELRRNKVLVNYTPAAVVLEDIHEEEEDEEDSSSEGEGESEEY